MGRLLESMTSVTLADFTNSALSHYVLDTGQVGISVLHVDGWVGI